MRPLSDETQELIRQLLDPPSLGARLFGAKNESGELLSRIGSAAEPASIPYLFPPALRGDPVSGAAAAAIARIVEVMSPLEVMELDRWLRRSGYDYWQFSKWDQVRPADLSRADRLPDSWGVWAIAACHRNGHVREAAIQRLAGALDRKTLPFLILRLNDWVQPVRQAAEDAFHAFLEAPDAEALVRSLPLLLRLPSWGRRNHRPLLERVQWLLQQPFARQPLAQGRESEDRGVRRECYRLSLDAPDLDPVPVVERGLADADVLVRLQAARLLRRMNDETLHPFLEASRRDRLVGVRREALEIAVSRFPQEALTWLQVALLDSHPSVREMARRHLHQQQPAFDQRAFYREAIRTSEGRRLPAALLGLQEIGVREDAQLAVAFCEHPRTKVREAAVRAVARLDYEGHSDVILRALSDPNPRVSRWAAAVLREKRIFSMTAPIWEYVRSDQQPKHVRLTALHLLGSLSKWALLPFLLWATALTDQDIVFAAREQVELWLAHASHSYVKPTAEQAEEILRLLGEASETLGPSLTERIEAEVRFWRGIT